jgi:hypothetical protein
VWCRLNLHGNQFSEGGGIKPESSQRHIFRGRYGGMKSESSQRHIFWGRCGGMKPECSQRHIFWGRCGGIKPERSQRHIFWGRYGGAQPLHLRRRRTPLTPNPANFRRIQRRKARSQHYALIKLISVLNLQKCLTKQGKAGII